MEIDLKRINKKYNNETVLESVNLSFKSNKVYFVIGESGCGKSTLIKIIGGLIDDYDGEVLFDGCNIKNIDKKYLRKEIISYIDQYSYLLEYLTINENADFIVNKKISKRYLKKFKYYSGGEKRRIATYISSLKNSKIILADEISSSLDKENALRIMNYLRKIAKNKILIVVTHDLFLVQDDDEVINLEKRQRKLDLSKRKFKYTRIHNKDNPLSVFKYSFIKTLSNKKYVVNFVSSFMIGLVLILLVSSLKTGIVSFLDNTVLKEFNYNCLLIENEEGFLYGDEDLFNDYSSDSLILLDDFYFDQLKNMVCLHNNDKLIYFSKSNKYMVSKELYKQNNYSHNFNLNGYEIYAGDIFDSSELIIRCPISFFHDYYSFRGYKLNNIKSNNIVIFIDGDEPLNLYNKISKDFPNLKVKNVGIEAYLYIDDLLNKIEYLLLVFIVISMLITFFLVLTIIKLDIKDEQKEISYLRISGFSDARIISFYYLTNLYRGLITLFLTVIFYGIVVMISNKILMKQLDLEKKILSVTGESLLTICLLILLIITLSVFFSVKELKQYKK